MRDDDPGTALALRLRYRELTAAYRSLEALIAQAQALTKQGYEQYQRLHAAGGLPLTGLGRCLDAAAGRSEEQVARLVPPAAERSSGGEPP